MPEAKGVKNNTYQFHLPLGPKQSYREAHLLTGVSCSERVRVERGALLLNSVTPWRKKQASANKPFAERNEEKEHLGRKKVIVERQSQYLHIVMSIANNL